MSDALYPVTRDATTWLQQQLARYTYKPGWTLEIRNDVQRGPMLRIGYTAPDSRGTDIPVPVSGRFPIPPAFVEMPSEIGEQEFGAWLGYVLMEAERHESQEWLRRDGTILNDPHTR